MKKLISGQLYALSILVAPILFAVLSQPACADDLLLVDKLINEKKFPEAYDRATLMLDEYAGEANFDFLYAIAAIESGHPHHAIFPLERLVHQFPDNGRIKVELARAHFLAGDDKTSEDIFNDVLRTTPPENVKQKIQIFLRLIEDRRLARQNKVSASIKITAGWDSNYNSAPDLNVVQIGGINFTLNENSRQQDTHYTGIEANLNYRQVINKKLLMTYGANYQQRQNIGNELDIQTIGVFLSPFIAAKNSTFRLPVQFQQLDLDGDSYRQFSSIGLEWNPTRQTASQWTHFIQYGIIRYPDQPARDVNLATIGTSYQRQSKKGSLYQIAFFYNDEAIKKESGKHNEADSFGLRSFIKWPLNAKNSLYNKISLQSLEYGKIHPVFNMLRDDQLYSIAIGWEYKLNRVTILRSEAEYSDNSSNVNVYDYDRTSALISLRYNF